MLFQLRGVVIERHLHPLVENYLVIHKRCYLAIETHEAKVEHLEVTEGAGLILSQEAPGNMLAAIFFDFHPPCLASDSPSISICTVSPSSI